MGSVQLGQDAPPAQDMRGVNPGGVSLWDIFAAQQRQGLQLERIDGRLEAYRATTDLRIGAVEQSMRSAPQAKREWVNIWLAVAAGIIIPALCSGLALLVALAGVVVNIVTR